MAPSGARWNGASDVSWASRELAGFGLSPTLCRGLGSRRFPWAALLAALPRRARVYSVHGLYSTFEAAEE
jgi:hypothetical protein